MLIEISLKVMSYAFVALANIFSGFFYLDDHQQQAYMSQVLLKVSSC